MQPLVIIPARGGSKGIPGKNIKPLGGKPLIEYTIEAALSAFSSEQIVVSTDDTSIQRVAENCGIPVPKLRPAHLATDTATSQDVILHCMQDAANSNFEFNTVVLLQPTSPFRTGHHIEEAVKLYDQNLDMVVSVHESDANPYYSLFEENDEQFLEPSKVGSFTRRQDCPKVYEYNGAIYVMNPESLKKKAINKFERIRKYEMEKRYSIDLDTTFDWELAEFLLGKLD